MKILSVNSFLLTVGSFETVTGYILKKISKRKPILILPCSLNDLALSARSQEIREIYKEIDLCTTDGMPLVWWAKWKYNNEVEGARGSDLMRIILTKTQGLKFKHYFVAASDNTITKLQNTLKVLTPKINVAGSSLLKRKSSEKTEDQILKSLKKSQPTILWVGIGSPKGVELAAKWKGYLPNTTIFCVGAAFDLVSGIKPSAPVWIQSAGLEWLFRLVLEPRRLWKRYLVDIPLYLFFYLPKDYLLKKLQDKTFNNID